MSSSCWLAALRGVWALVHGFVMLKLSGQLRRGGDLAAVRAYLRGWADNAYDDQTAGWSPIGNEILFVAYPEGNWRIYIAEADSTNQRQVLNVRSRQLSASWLPNGEQIAFVSDWRSRNFEIYLMNANGNLLHRLTNNALTDASPDWTSDGQHIVFESWRDGNHVQRLTYHPARDGFPSADGEW